MRYNTTRKGLLYTYLLLAFLFGSLSTLWVSSRASAQTYATTTTVTTYLTSTVTQDIETTVAFSGATTLTVTEVQYQSTITSSVTRTVSTYVATETGLALLTTQTTTITIGSSMSTITLPESVSLIVVSTTTIPQTVTEQRTVQTVETHATRTVFVTEQTSSPPSIETTISSVLTGVSTGEMMQTITGSEESTRTILLGLISALVMAGIVIAFFFSRTGRPRVIEPSMRRCVYCSAMIPPHVTQCPYCGHRLEGM